MDYDVAVETPDTWSMRASGQVDQDAEGIIGRAGQLLRADYLRVIEDLRNEDPDLYSDLEAPSPAELDQRVADSGLDAWEYNLTVAARERGIQTDFLHPHAAVVRALELLQARLPAKQPAWGGAEVSQLSPQAEEIAQRIAAKAPNLLLDKMSEAQKRVLAKQSLAHPNWPAASLPEPSLDELPAEQWYDALHQLATEELGASSTDVDPVAARAMALTGAASQPTRDEQVVTEAKESATRAAGAPPRPPGLPGEYRPPPANPPAGLEQLRFQVKHLGGHPGIPVGRPRLWLEFTPWGAHLMEGGFGGETREAGDIQWGKVRALQIEGATTIQRRVTIPRLALGGLLAFAKKKEEKRSYLVFNTTVGEIILEVDGSSPMELRGALAPVLSWLRTERSEERGRG